MSYDFAIQQNCKHQIMFETASYNPVTGISTFVRQPNSANVIVWVDGVSIPQYGLYSYASLPFTNPEPYRITAGVNDLLYIGIGQNVAQFVQLLIGQNISAAAMAADLQLKLPSLSVTTSNSTVVISSLTPINGAAFLYPDPRWTDKTSSSPLTVRALAAFSTLGIVPGRVVTGAKILPGWVLTGDPTSPVPTARAVQFTSVLPNANPLIQLSYSVPAGDCPRCFGSRIEYDYDVLNGTYETVQNTDLLAQEFDKYLFTVMGSSWKWTWLGSNISTRIGGKNAANGLTANALIQTDVNQAFRAYQDIKSQQAQGFPSQMVSDAEYPQALVSVAVNPLSAGSTQYSTVDPTTAVVNIVIQSKSTVPVPLQRILGTPNPFTLVGAQSGGQTFFAAG